MKVVNIKQRSTEWHEFRRTVIGASDAPVIMGLSPWKNVSDLILEKTLQIQQSDNPYMQRGRELESVALESFENETGLTMFPIVGVHDELNWMAASFDGMTIERNLICEIKCPGQKDHHFVSVNKKVPPKYYPQLQHQIYVSGLEFSYYYSFDGVNGITIEVKRDQAYIQEMIEKEFNFWNTLQDFNLSNNLIAKENHDCTTFIIP